MSKTSILPKQITDKIESSILVEIKPELKSLLETGYFTVNNTPYNFSSDRWDFSESLIYKNIEKQALAFDFTRLSDENSKIAMKLWTYWQISNGKSKIRTCRAKVYSIINIYCDMEKDKIEVYFLSPREFVIADYFTQKHAEYYYTYLITLKHTYLEFLDFVSDAFYINQDVDTLDYLRNYNNKRMQACCLASIDDAIPPAYFNRLYNFCQRAIDDTEMDDIYRILCASLILYSQTGLRRSELLATTVQAIQQIDESNSSSSIYYFVAPISKNVSGKDTIVNYEKIPLNNSSRKAFDFLLERCAPYRQKINSNRLIVFPTQSSATLRSDTFRIRFILMLIKYHRELDSFDTQSIYPELHTTRIADLNPSIQKHMEIKRLSDTERKSTLVYPILHQFRKTFATSLHQLGEPVETISNLLHHYDTRITSDYYITPYVSQKDVTDSKEVHQAIFAKKSNVPQSKRSELYIERLKKKIENKEFSICKSKEELADLLSNNHTLHARKIGFCLKSDLLPCTHKQK